MKKYIMDPESSFEQRLVARLRAHRRADPSEAGTGSSHTMHVLLAFLVGTCIGMLVAECAPGVRTKMSALWINEHLPWRDRRRRR